MVASLKCIAPCGAMFLQPHGWSAIGLEIAFYFHLTCTKSQVTIMSNTSTELILSRTYRLVGNFSLIDLKGKEGPEALARYIFTCVDLAKIDLGFP